MSKNCLVTKLKSVVENDNLHPMGVLALRIENGVVDDTKLLEISFLTRSNKVKVVKGSIAAGGSADSVTVYNQGETLTYTGEHLRIYVRSSSALIEIDYPNIYSFNNTLNANISIVSGTLKYNNISNRCNLGNIHLTDNRYFENMSNVKQISFTNANFDIIDFTPNTKVERFTLRNIKPIDINNSQWPTSVNNVISGYFKGTITSIANLVNMTQFDASGSTSLIGRIEDLADAMAQNKDSGTLRCNVVNTGVTYQGNLLRKTINIIFTGSGNYTIEAIS